VQQVRIADGPREHLRKNMKPVFQTRFGAPHGNCFAACVVSIIGGRLEDFPDLSDLAVDEATANAERQRRIETYLHERGYDIVRRIDAMPPEHYVVGVGEGPRGLPHACVFLDGRLVHDPSPAGGGVKGVEAWYLISTAGGALPPRAVR
jgi:hypothetical protein